MAVFVESCFRLYSDIKLGVFYSVIPQENPNPKYYNYVGHALNCSNNKTKQWIRAYAHEPICIMLAMQFYALNIISWPEKERQFVATKCRTAMQEKMSLYFLHLFHINILAYHNVIIEYKHD